MLLRTATTAIFLSLPASADPFDTFQDCDACPVMIEVPMGSFLMGAPEDEFRRNMIVDGNGARRASPGDMLTTDKEGPQHVVEMDIHFAMSRDEVTYDQWMHCVRDGGCNGYESYSFALVSSGPNQGDIVDIIGNHPISSISFNDAQSYIFWLNEIAVDGLYRLPTEAEWEYVARAGTQTPFYQGVTVTSNQANFSGMMTRVVMVDNSLDLETRGVQMPVTDLNAINPWGFRHMVGNVSEITLSCYTEYYAGWATASDWLINSYGEVCDRVYRGGSFGSPIDVLRSGRRGHRNDSSRPSTAGFRVVKEINIPLQ